MAFQSIYSDATHSVKNHSELKIYQHITPLHARFNSLKDQKQVPNGERYSTACDTCNYAGRAAEPGHQTEALQKPMALNFGAASLLFRLLSALLNVFDDALAAGTERGPRHLTGYGSQWP